MLGGKPLINWVFATAEAIDCNDIAVSTNDPEILANCSGRPYTIIKRPERLCVNTVSRVDAIRHAVIVAEYINQREYDIIIDLGAANPFTRAEDVREALKPIENRVAYNVFSVVPARASAYFMQVKYCASNGYRLVEDANNTCRQNAPVTWDMTDNFNIWARARLFCDSPQFGSNNQIYTVPPESAIHVDTEWDFKLASLIANEMKT
jgi:CMP-N-acetylneuraminic acid synthetase